MILEGKLNKKRMHQFDCRLCYNSFELYFPQLYTACAQQRLALSGKPCFKKSLSRNEWLIRENRGGPGTTGICKKKKKNTNLLQEERNCKTGYRNNYNHTVVPIVTSTHSLRWFPSCLSSNCDFQPYGKRKLDAADKESCRCRILSTMFVPICTVEKSQAGSAGTKGC